MIVYNVTINLDPSIHDQWMDWMQTKHIAEILETNLFLGARLFKVRVEDPDGAITYAIQYFADSDEKLQQYYDHFAEKLRAEGKEKFGEKMLGFRTELELVNDFFIKK